MVTPNWTVNPTAASAIAAAVTIPKPIACRKMRWLPSGEAPGGGGLTPGPPCAGARARAWPLT